MDTAAIKQLLDAAAKPSVHRLDDDHQIALLPPGHTVRDLADVLPPPDRIVQAVTLLTPEDFCAYLAAYGESSQGESLAVFCDEGAARYEAVLDYHLNDGTRGDASHVVHYACPLSAEWQLWTKNNGAKMSQAAFAPFIEDNTPDIVDPPAADMLQVALQLQVHKSAKFESELRLDSGQRQLKYVEEVRGSVGSGQMLIPGAFTLSIPVISDGERIRIQARLRFRMTDGVLVIWYDLVRPEEILRDAVKRVTAKIRATIAGKLGKAKVLLGHRD